MCIERLMPIVNIEILHYKQLLIKPIKMPFDFFNSDASGGNPEKMEKADYLKGAGGGLTIMAVIVFYALELDHFENTIGVKSLLIFSFIFGALIGVGLAYYISKRLTDPVERIILFVPIFLCVTLLMPLLVSSSNRILSFSEVQQIEVQFLQTNRFVKSRFGEVEGLEDQNDGYFLFFVKDGEPKRVKMNENYYPLADRGDKIKVPIRRGLYGFEFVEF